MNNNPFHVGDRVTCTQYTPDDLTRLLGGAR